jgi:hypothetical protein
MALQHLRSSTANKRPTPAAMSDGQLALNTNLVSPGLFFKDSNGDSVKVGPVHVGTTAPNATPGAGGQAGNSKGEQWLDTSSSRYVFKIWDGTAWRSEDGEFVNTSGDTMTGALGIIAGTAAAPGVFFSGDTNTGIYSPGADQLAVATNGTGRLFVDSAGDVGIGISVPTAQLHVANVGTNDSFIVEDSGSDATPFRIDSSGGVFTGSQLVVGAQEAYSDGNSTIGRAQINSAGLNNSRTFSHIHWGGNPRFRHCSTPSTTLGTHTISALSNVIGAHEFYASDGVNFIPSASIQSTVDATPSVGVVPGNLTFSTAPAGTLTERLRITSAGLVGIGTTSPASPLHIVNSSAGTANGIELNNFTGDSSYVKSGRGLTLAADFDSNSSGDQSYISFETDAVERVKINSVGRLLVGTSSARESRLGLSTYQTQFQLESEDTAAGLATSRFNDATGSSFVNLQKGRGTIASPAAVIDDDATGTIVFSGWDGAAFTNSALIKSEVDGTPSTDDMPGRLVFSTTADGDSSVTERMRIHSDGNVSIGSATNTGDQLYVNGTIRSNGQIQTLIGDTDTAPGYTWQGDEDTGMFRTGANSLGFSASGSEIARFNFSGTSGRRQLYFENTAEVWSAGSLYLEGVTSVRSVTIKDDTTANAANVVISSSAGTLQRSTSSIKYKTDVEDAELSYSEALVYGSRPVWYRSLSESDPSEYSYWGFIAEEVAEIDPRMVHWGDDGPEGVQYDRYVVHLVSVIQKQQQRLDALEARLTAAGI